MSQAKGAVNGDTKRGIKNNAEGFAHALEMGFSVIPTNPANKRPLLSVEADPETHEVTGSVEEDTAGWKPYQDTRADAATVQRWLRKWPYANPTLITGGISGLVAVDQDGPLGEATLRSKEYKLDPSVCVRSPGGAKRFHIWYAYPYELGVVRNFSKGYYSTKERDAEGHEVVVFDLPGVDLRGDGGYVLYPGATHPNGGLYEFVPGYAPGEIPIAPVPSWLEGMIRGYNERKAAEAVRVEEIMASIRERRLGGLGSDAYTRRLHAYAAGVKQNHLGKLLSSGQGGRNNQLFETAAQLGAFVEEGVWSEFEVVLELEQAARSVGLDKDSGGMGAVQRTIRSGLSRGRRQPVVMPDVR